ncbi:MAG: MFS transporter [Salinarimonas sp.]
MSGSIRAAFYFSAGLLAASALGVASYYLVDLRRDLDLGPAVAGLAVSVITLVGAVFGFLVGTAITRVSVGACLSFGLAVLGASSLVAATADGAAAFLASRLVAGVGFTTLVAALPVAIALVDDALARRAALTMWGSFLPLGIALGTGIAAAATSDWRVALNAHGIVCLAAAAVALRIDAGRRMPKAENGARPLTLLRDRVALSFAAGFAAFAAIFLIAVVLLPGYLRTAAALGDAQAGVVAAFVCATSALTSLALVCLLPRMRRFLPLVIVGFAGAALAGCVFYLASGSAVVGVAAAVVVIVLSALVPSGVFATLPLIASPEDVGPLSGLVAQMGSLGSLVGPPLVTWWTAQFGWASGVVPFCAICLLGMALFVAPSRRMETAKRT